ncbi:ParB/RepB/Spo0J family partition protein [Saccharopolyspora cebuensis]|uniref:ParB/RepB/Spo0J family partition protein n=1 Tax=Saccharopolyspora cebuensis TaxID=418759 RepID=UPI0031E8D78C
MGRRKSFVELAPGGPMNVTDPASANVPPTRVPVDQCARRPDNPRPSSLDVAELADSIAEMGQLQPATVASRESYLAHRPDHAEAIGAAQWVVLAGNRRHAACEKAGVAELLVHVTDEQVPSIIEIGIIENIQREPLPPVREAHELQQLKDRYGTTREVGKRIGKTHVYVHQRLSLLQLVPQLQTAVDAGELKIADARDLAKLPQAKQMSAYEAGPPYADKPKPAPAAGVVPGDTSTYQRTNLDQPPATPTPAGPAEEPVAVNAVTKERPAPVAVEDPFGSPLMSAPDTVTEPAPQPTAVATPASQLPGDPFALAELIEREYTEEQRRQLVELLAI